METYRLKNIAIVILLLLNGFLLLLTGYQSLRSRQTAAGAAGQLKDLYEAKGLSLDGGVDLSQQPLSPLTLTRWLEEEQDMASFLLGGDAVSASQGGGIFSYATEYGSIQFRSGGSFNGSRLSLAVEDAAAFSREFCQRFGYADVDISTQGGAVVVTAGQRAEGVPITGCKLTLRFENGTLTSAAGVHVSLADAVSQEERQINCVTALVRFLDYRESSSIVCSAVEDVACVYALQSGVSLRLSPVWRVKTDTYTYFVDCASGAVTRQ